MEKTTYKWFIEHEQEIFNGETPRAFCVISDKPEVHTGDENDCDIDYCNEHNIPVYKLERRCGTCVCCDGTIGIALFTDVKDGWQCNKFVNSFGMFLKNKGLNPKADNNDILLDGYKTASAGEWRVGENSSHIYGVYLISYDVDLDAIRSICKKEMKKEPKGLKDFGLTKEELIAWCENYFDGLIKGLNK